jgi:hypothetical protein
MLLMVTIGYVFSYLMPSKQKSIIFPIQSTQAFFIAQSGVEFAVRYAITQTPPWTTPAQLAGLTNVTRNLGAGRFTLTYTNVAPDLDTLISVGEVPSGTERRKIRVSSFTTFLGGKSLILSTPDPCVERNNHERVEFYITNDGTLPVVLNSFSGQWTHSPARDLNRIYLNGTEKYRDPSGGYPSNGGQRNFNRNPAPPGVSTFTINPGNIITVELRFDNDIRGAQNVTIYFYDTEGNPYQFVLITGLGGLQECPP